MIKPFGQWKGVSTGEKVMRVLLFVTSLLVLFFLGYFIAVLI